MNFKKIVTLSTLSLASLSLLTACGSSESSNGGKTEITFWASNNPTQLKFWNKMAKDFEEANPKIDVKVSQMKNAPTSEAYIQSAIASDTAPTMSENISRSFAAQLAESKAILPLNKESFFSDLTEKRQMKETIKPWEFSDGNQYVLPVYSNPIFMAWRTDKLKELGIEKTPKTYADILAVAEKLQGNKNLALWAAPALADPTSYQRWFDYFPLYYGASKGADWVKDGKYVADGQANEAVFSLMETLSKKGVLQTGQSTNPFEKGDSLVSVTGAWVFENWKTQFPELQYGKTYDISSPFVPDGTSTENVKTYSDAKGISIYASATKEEKKAAVKFLKFVFEDEKKDLEWLNTTSLTPARDDITSNAVFSDYFAKNPQMKVIAEMIPNAIPAIDNGNYNDIQEKFGVKAWVPVVSGKSDAKSAVDNGKTALKEVLKNEKK